jgi:paraquat-inducible protein B
MADESPIEPPDDTPQAHEHSSRWPGWIWAIPIAAVVIVGYLAFRQIAAAGPSVTVTFPTGGGLTAGNTKVVYEGITVGTVSAVKFDKDMRRVNAVLSLNSDMAGHLGKGTRFWIAGAQPSITNLASLRSVIAGPHVGIEPHPGSAQSHYVGLAQRPPNADKIAVTHFVLHADKLGNISRGSPVYYRSLQVGSVASTHLDPDGQHFRIDLFIKKPYQKLVHADTRFWDASPVQLSMASGGPRVEFQSVPALFEGAIAFETPWQQAPGTPAAANSAFTLYNSRSAAKDAPNARAVPYRVVFQASQAGALAAGAPVTLEQKRVGSVTRSTLEYDPKTGKLEDQVTLALDPADIVLSGQHWASNARPQMDAMLRHLVGEGLRARLGSTIPMVGGKTVELAFVGNVSQASLGSGAMPEIPTGPASGISGIMAALSDVAGKLDAMPLDQIADNVHAATQRLAKLSKSPQLTDALRHLNDSMTNITDITRSARGEVPPVLADLRQAAIQAQGAVAGVRKLVSSNAYAPTAPETASMGHTLYELSRAARSLRELTDYLNRNPSALLLGKR